ncbi:cytochrome b5-like heme/steroid-binding domain protein [Rhizoctonia solani AG-3 Rhs1AP]|uniref:Cytochrome b5-like heme/steroid-binding domain protein n=2 Tax=Rhizoctonia solani AG-3 TaxID=1086053 RepID=A0A074SAY6_9AGAM|nr:cytochrome b5-like heme/steroid-binding domain protein [Rhizoctonia solani AG-3 Rhs1AP]KEP54068.1 cytochrome b5-like heme/steroid-binding domain protein [Rhizoctonia solani 123E]
MAPGIFANYSATSIAIAAAAVAVPSYWLFSRQRSQGQTSPAGSATAKRNPFAVPDGQLQPPKDDPYTLAELSAYDGRDPGRPVYVAIKGMVFDVTAKRDVYGPGGSYSVFAGKDGSKGLGLSSLKAEDAVPDWSTLEEKERGVLNDWYAFFSKRYNVVGKVSDLPSNVAPPVDKN